MITRTLIVACAALLAACGVAHAESAKRPNVVLIMTDNHGAWTLGCYGNPEIRTPNIDCLASAGTLFTRAFASNPVCSPTRATFLTGLVPSQHGVHSFLAGGGLQVGPDARCTLDQFTSLPEVLSNVGYACGLVGKWHLGANMSPQEGFNDYWITMPHGGTSTFYNAAVIENGQIRNDPTYLTDLWTEHAVKFIDRQSSKDEPFFLFLAYNGPYSLGRLLLKEGENRHAEFYADQELASFPRTPTHPWQFHNRDYINHPTAIRRVATEVSGVDDGVGEVLKALKDRGLDDNTVVVFVADQGWVGGHGGFFGMGDHTRPTTARDGMMQIPMIWRHPNQIAAGARRDEMIANYDFLPTLLGHLNLSEHLPNQPKSPGKDFSSILHGERTPTPPHDAVFYEFEQLRCIRTTTHKYIHRFPNGPHELYDLERDPEEFVNLVDNSESDGLRTELKSRMDAFYSEYSLPKYDLCNGGGSQARLHQEIDEEAAQLISVQPPPGVEGFKPAEIRLPDGFEAELVASPPLVTHPTMGCFDDLGCLYVCNNAGVNMTNTELEKELPNEIRRLEDRDHDGTFDSFTVFADKMTFPMGGAWHDGSLYVASPPNIWRLTDTDDDGVADQREILVSKFGYNGNAASIHGCFWGPDGRMYWCDGYHGHEFKDEHGAVTSKREGSYIFSCKTDGSDVQIHCGGGMDNPVEIDFTPSGDILGTVNILYTRPRVDALVHWLHGGAYPHRERVLDEIKVTGELLGPAHRFGHVAVSGVTRYRSGAMDHRWSDNQFVTFFNSGKVARLSLDRVGSTFGVTQHEFLSSPNQDFHPTDVIEDADGSLLVIDTGGWFYRGCPTSQLSKPELLGGIYRVKRKGMTPLLDPRGLGIDWSTQTPSSLVKLLNDTRFAVREQAIHECVRRGAEMLPVLSSSVSTSDIRIRQNAVWSLARIAQQTIVVDPGLARDAVQALRSALDDQVADIRQAACLGLARSPSIAKASWIMPLLNDRDASVRRQAATTLGIIGDSDAVQPLVDLLHRDDIDREEEHAAIFALIEIGDAKRIRESMSEIFSQSSSRSRSIRGVLVALDQIDGSTVEFDEAMLGLLANDPVTVRVTSRIVNQHPEWASRVASMLREQSISENTKALLLAALIKQESVAAVAGELLQDDGDHSSRAMSLRAIAVAGRIQPHASWVTPLRRELQSSDEAAVTIAIQAVSSLDSDVFVEVLKRLVDDESRTSVVRMNALAAITNVSGKLDDETFDRVIKHFVKPLSPTSSSLAAQILGTAKLSPHQLEVVAPLLTDASPNDLRVLITSFQRGVDQKLAKQFLHAMETSDALTHLTVNEFSDVVKGFPPDVLDQANQILGRLKEHHQEKLLRLETLRSKLASGDAQRGESLFFNEKSKCSVCHRVGDKGNRVGPELTTIGSNRTSNDLLESIVFPSASIVRDYESYKVLTEDGRVITGIVVSETNDVVVIQQASGEKVELGQNEIEELSPNTVSIMPGGLDQSLTEQELLDVVSYLQGLR